MEITFAARKERAEVAARIDPKTATVFRQGRMVADPYGDLTQEQLDYEWPEGPIPQTVTNFDFAFGPDGKAVLVEDLPAATQEALEAAGVRSFHLHPDDMGQGKQ